MLKLESLWEMEIAEKQAEIDQKQLEIDQKRLSIRYSREQLLIQRRKRALLQAVPCANGDPLLEELHPSDLSKKKMAKDQLKEIEEETPIDGGPGQPSGIELSPKSHTATPEDTAHAAIIRTAADIKSNKMDDNNVKKTISTSNRTPPKSLVLKLKLPTHFTRATNVETTAQSGTSQITSSVTKPPNTQNQSKTKPKRRTARMIELEEEILLELAELGASTMNEPAKRLRPAAGVYTIGDFATDLELRDLLARFCNPMIQIFRDALKGITTSNSQLSRSFDDLQRRLEQGTLNPEDGLSEWVLEMEETLEGQSPGFRRGTDREMLLSKLQRWSEQWDHFMYSCVYEPYFAQGRLGAVDRLVGCLTQEFTSLSEDIRPIVRSDIV